jgi:hypothetical protein
LSSSSIPIGSKTVVSATDVLWQSQ